MTGIEPALSAWESVLSRAVKCPELRSVLSASDRDRHLVTAVNGTLMARRRCLREWMSLSTPMDAVSPLVERALPGLLPHAPKAGRRVGPVEGRPWVVLAIRV